MSLIATYHAIGPGPVWLATDPVRLDAQLEGLARAGYRGVTLSDLLAQTADQQATKQVAITFDDGFASVYEHGWPRLRAYGWPATLFLVSDYCGRESRWPGQPPSAPSAPLMSWAQATELASAGWEIGAHSRSHPPLTELTPQRAEAEIIGSRDAINAQLGQPPRTFAYPYGATNRRIRRLVAGHYDAAVGTRLGLVSATSDRHCLPRVDAYYLEPGLIAHLSRPAGRLYLALRQALRDLRRLAIRDWQPLETAGGAHG